MFLHPGGVLATMVLEICCFACLEEVSHDLPVQCFMNTSAVAVVFMSKILLFSTPCSLLDLLISLTRLVVHRLGRQ